MSKAVKGNVVRVDYTGRLKSGEVFDSSKDRDPLQFTLGSGQVIPGFDNGILGMAVGEKKTINIPSAEAYGEYRQDMIAQLDRKESLGDMVPEIGQEFELCLENGAKIPVRVHALTEDTVTLDANHPLAGKDLIFEVELKEIRAE